jgi:leucyl aminopeptidase
VIGVGKGGKGPVVAPGAEAVDKAYDGRLAGVLETLGASGAEGEVTKLPAPAGFKAPLVLAVGLGAEPEEGRGFGAEALRRAAGVAARALAGSPRRPPSRCRSRTPPTRARSPRARCSARTPSTRTRAKDGKSKDAKDARPQGSARRGRPARRQAARQGVQGGRRACHRGHRGAQPRPRPDQHPAERPRPEAFAAVAQTAAKEHGIKVEVLDEKALEKGGYGGILGVGAGSAAGPRLVKLSYTHAKATKHLAFVGKGITYDSGGISLKPAGHNETMKCDMSGAAAVFAAVVAAARLGLEVNVTGWLALAENMPSGSATVPVTCCACTAARPSRSSTRTPRAGSSSRTRCARRPRRSRTRSWTWRR